MIPWLADVVASLTALLAQASVDTATWTLAELRSKGRNSFDRLHDHSQLPAEISRHRCVFYACLLREAVSLLSSSPPTPNASHLSPRAISDHSSCYALIDESFSLLPQDASPALRDSARLLSAVALIDLAALFGPHGASTSSGGRSAGGHMGGYIDKGAADALACAAAACAERIPHAHTLALTAPVRSSMRASDSASQVDSGVALGVGGVGDDDDGNGSDDDDDDDDVSKCADGNRPHDRCNASVQTLQWLTRPVATVRAVRSVTATSAASQLLSVSAADDTAANSQPVPVVLRAAADAWGWTAHTRWPSIGLAETQTRTQTSPATTADAAQATAVDASPPMSCLVSVLLARVWPLEPAWVPYTRAHWRPTLARGAALWRGLSSHSGQCPRRAREGCGPAGSEAGRCSECEHAGLYLAQHPVLARVPQLRGDAPAPDCCALPPPSHSSSRRVSATSDATAVQSPSVGARPMLVLPASVSAAALGAEAAMRPRLALPAPKNAAARLALPTASATVRALSMHIPHAGEAALTCSVTPTVEPTVKRARIAVAGPDLSTTTSDAATEDSLAAEDEDTMVVSNCWIGPVGTVSPLHTDPDDNLLCQVVGSKTVVLFAPAAGPALGLRSRSGKLANTARARITTQVATTTAQALKASGAVAGESAEADPVVSANVAAHRHLALPTVHIALPHPARARSSSACKNARLAAGASEGAWREAEAWVARLGPGDALYIPRGWWHHVQADQMQATSAQSQAADDQSSPAFSASVNYWWRVRS